MTRRCATRIILVIWLASLVLALPWALYFTLAPLETSAEGAPLEPLHLCTENWPDEASEIAYFVVANLSACYIIPLIVITVCYLGIWVKVWRRAIPGEQVKGLPIELLMQRSKLKVAKMFLAVVVVFILSWVS